MGPEIAVEVRGQRFRGFESVMVRQSMDAFASTFELGYSNRASARESESLVLAGDRVRITHSDDDVLEGHVVRDRIQLSAERRVYSAGGVSLLGDLEDCSAGLTGRPRSFRDVTLRSLVDTLVAEYGITVVDNAQASEPLKSFALKRNEKIAAAIRRACRLRGVWTVDIGGWLELTSGTLERFRGRLGDGDRLSEGGSRQRDWSQRFSRYRFRGQSSFRDVTSIRRTAGEEVESRDGEEIERRVRRAREVAQEVEDPIVTRLRRLEVVAHGKRQRDLGQRAVLERAQRAGRSESYTLPLRGWTAPDGQLWRPNRLIHVRSEDLRVDAELLIVDVASTYGVSPARYETTLQLVPPEAYEFDPDEL